MIIRHLENWKLTASGIVWCGNYGVDIVVPKNSMYETNGEGMYKWMRYVTELVWLKDEDAYMFCTVFLGSAKKFYGIKLNADFVSKSMDRVLEMRMPRLRQRSEQMVA